MKSIWKSIEFEGTYYPKNLDGIAKPEDMGFEKLDIDCSCPVWVIFGKAEADNAFIFVESLKDTRNTKEKARCHLPPFSRWVVDYTSNCCISESRE